METEEDEAAFLAIAHKFLANVSYGGPVLQYQYDEILSESVSRPSSSSSNSRDKQTTLISGTEWLNEIQSSSLLLTTRAKLVSKKNSLLCAVSLFGYTPAHFRKLKAKQDDQALTKEILLPKPIPGKVHSYRHLLPRFSDGSKNDQNSSSSSSRSESDEEDGDIGKNYDPEFLDNPELKSGKHRTGSINHFTKTEFLKKEINEKFRKLHSNVHPTLTLSQIRALKANLLAVGFEQGVELSSIARAFTYLEILILERVVCKTNRRVIGACCLLLASKASTDIRSTDYGKLLAALIAKLSPVSKKEIVDYEFVVLAKLSFKLQLGEKYFGVHLNRILNSFNYSNLQEYLGERMYQQWQSTGSPPNS